MIDIALKDSIYGGGKELKDTYEAWKETGDEADKRTIINFAESWKFCRLIFADLYQEELNNNYDYKLHLELETFSKTPGPYTSAELVRIGQEIKEKYIDKVDNVKDFFASGFCVSVALGSVSERLRLEWADLLKNMAIKQGRGVTKGEEYRNHFIVGK